MPNAPAPPELNAAREVQSRFLPAQSTPVKGIDYYAEYEPSGGVGGNLRFHNAAQQRPGHIRYAPGPANCTR